MAFILEQPLQRILDIGSLMWPLNDLQGPILAMRWPHKRTASSSLPSTSTKMVTTSEEISFIFLDHSGAKIHVLSKNWHTENPNFYKIHISKISCFIKFTFMKSHFSQNSHFWNHIFHKIHIFKVSFFTKFTFLVKKLVFVSVCSYRNTLWTME